MNMNNKISLIILIFLIFIVSCQKKQIHLRAVTDDISVFSLIGKFNSENKNIKISLDYWDKSQILTAYNENNNIFDYIIKNQVKIYDIVIGNSLFSQSVDNNNFLNLSKFHYFNDNIDYNNLYKVFSDYLLKNDGAACLYSLDFPVIIVKKSTLSETFNKSSISIEDFCNIAKNINYKKNDGKYNNMKIGFIPEASSLTELEYYFIFKTKFENNNNQYKFNSKNSQKAFEFYNYFNDNYNFGNESVSIYLKKYEHINTSNYLKHDVISLDFMKISNALSYAPEDYKLLFIKDLEYISLFQNIAAIPQTSVNKKEAVLFLQYLLNENSQKTLCNETYENLDFYKKIHLPIRKKIINEILNEFNEYNFEEYVKNLEYFNFYNKKNEKRFFEKYQFSKDMLDKGLIKESEFLDYFDKEFNK